MYVRKALALYGDLPGAWVVSTADAIRYRKAFSSLEAFCMFIGNPRSGSTLLGSLLDAHEEVVIAQDLNILRFVRSGFSRGQIFSIAVRGSRAFTSAGRRWAGYSYMVPGGAQGTFTTLRVVGDKRANGTLRMLRRYPHLLDRARARLRLPLRLLHVVRNPFDNIATIARRREVPLERAMEQYFRDCDTVVSVRSGLAPGELIDVRHEDVVSRPQQTLAAVCAFLGVEASDAYLERATSIVFAEPRLTRTTVEWSDRLRREVEEQIERHAFLRGYSFE